MPRLKKNPVAKLPPATEPQDVSTVSPTPYDYLFAETAEENPDLYKKIMKVVTPNV